MTSQQETAETAWMADVVAHFGGRTVADLPGYKNEFFGPWERWLDYDSHQYGG